MSPVCISGIYQIRNTTNDKIYIGSSINISRRWRTHKAHLQLNKHHSYHLQNAWNLYGCDVFIFEVLLYCSKEALIFFEQRTIDEYKPEYNMSPTAGSPLGIKHSDEYKRQCSLRNSGINNAMYGTVGELSPNYGKKRTDETKEKMSIAQSGTKNAMFGKHHTKEAKDKIRCSHPNISGENHPRVKLNQMQVNRIRDLALTLSQKEIAILYSISFQHVSDIVNNKKWKLND